MKLLLTNRILLATTTSLLCLSPCLAQASADTAASTKDKAAAIETSKDIKTLATISSSLRSRLEKDHRVRVIEENFRGEKRLHVYLYLSEQPLPYMVSLGWFLPKEDTGLATAAPKAKPKGKGGLGSLLKKPITILGSKEKELLNPVDDRNRSLVLVDEFGITLPAPGSSPTEKNFDKADWHTILGFDRLSDSDLGGAEKEFNDAIKIAPTYARFNNNLGALYAAKGDYTDASPLFDRAIRENQDFAPAYANRALLSLAIGQPALALEDAQKALKLEPKQIPAQVAYARALMESGNTKDALTVAQTLKAEAPAEWQSMLVLADALLATGDFKESRSTLARLAVLNPSSSEIVMKLAHSYEKVGDLDNAIKYGRKATQLAPDDPKTHVALGRYLDSNRDANAAVLQFERAMDLKPERSLRKSAMGAALRILIANNKPENADQLSKKWQKQFPDDSESHFNRAWIMSQIPGDHTQECIDGYSKALVLEPTLHSAHYNLGLVLAKAGKNAQALKELKTFVEVSPNDSDTASAKELIKKLEAG